MSWVSEASALMVRLAELTERRIFAILIPDGVSNEWAAEFTLRASTLLDHGELPLCNPAWLEERRRKDATAAHPWIDLPE